MQEAGREDLNPRRRQNEIHEIAAVTRRRQLSKYPCQHDGGYAQRCGNDATDSDGWKRSVRGPRPRLSPAWRPRPTRRYFSDEFTEVNFVLRVDPMPLTAVMMTMLSPTAIRQYSMAVAPDRSARNLENSCRIQNSF